MSVKAVRARKALREWRLGQAPKVTQDKCGDYIGKSGVLIRHFEAGIADLIDGDCVKLSQRTGIPLSDFLTREEIRHILTASELLKEPDAAA